MAKSGVTTTINNAAKFLASVATLLKRDVLVGIPDTNAERYEDLKALRAAQKAANPTAPLPGLSNAQIGYIQENGAPNRNIPARPFLIPGVEEAQPKYTPHLKAAMVAALTGDASGCDRSLNAAGLVAQNSVKAKINSGIPPKLSDATIRSRLSRGRTGDKPLIDTGQLRNAITYVVRKL
jgi:hypothetical protein